MNHFSDKEYHILKTEASENKTSISRYIGYIITITGISGLIKFYFDNNIDAIGTIILFFLTLVVLTLLFEVIWYKFKSHNRLIGYIQVLMQEIDAIPYNKIKNEIEGRNDWADKQYLKNWKNYGVSSEAKGLKDFYGWEFAMSRYNSNVLFAKEETRDDRINNYCNAINKSKYIFSLPDKWVPYTEQMDCKRTDGTRCDRDVEFFEKIMLPIYFDKNALPLGSNFWDYFSFLLQDKAKTKPLKKLDVENRYLTYGWEYPRKITQIAFIAASLVYVFLSIFLAKNFKPINPFENTEQLEVFEKITHWIDVSLPLLFFTASTAIIVFWVRRYVKELVELLYGKFSIDYYCWQFFVYRIQMMNNKKLVPVFYSRSYLRYFKSKTYCRIFKINKAKIEENINDNEKNHLDNYQHYLDKHLDFNAYTDFDGNDNPLKSIHAKLVTAYKVNIEEPNTLPDDLDDTIYKMDDAIINNAFKDSETEQTSNED